MKIDIKMDLPFRHCEICEALSPEKYNCYADGIAYHAIIRCEHEPICRRADNARQEAEKND